MRIKILLADENKLIRNGLSELIHGENEMEVVAEAGNGYDAITLVKKHMPHIVVMDISMPGPGSVDTIKMILQHNFDIKVIALSIHSTRGYANEMLMAGASAYLVKHRVSEELVNAIRTVVKNKPYLSSQVIGTVLEEPVPIFSSDKPGPEYTIYPDEKGLEETDGQDLTGGSN